MLKSIARQAGRSVALKRAEREKKRMFSRVFAYLSAPHLFHATQIIVDRYFFPYRKYEKFPSRLPYEVIKHTPRFFSALLVQKLTVTFMEVGKVGEFPKMSVTNITDDELYIT